MTDHVRPNYVLIWLYLFLLTVAEVALAFELPISRNMKLLLLLVLAIWKALLVAMYFMHLKFDNPVLRRLFVTGLLLALGVYIVYLRIVTGGLSPNGVIFDALCLIMGMQMLFFAMWMDMEHNKGLK